MYAIQKKISTYNLDKRKKIKDIENKKNQELKNFLIQVTPIIESYMESNSINIILEKKNIFIANSKYDITIEIIKLIDKENN